MYPPSSSPTQSLSSLILIIASLTAGGLVPLWLPAYLSAPASEEEEEEVAVARVCMDMQWRGGFSASCSFVVATSARLGLLQVFVAAAESPMLCTAEHFLPAAFAGRCVQAVRQFNTRRLPGAVHLCGVLLPCVQLAGCDH